MSDEYSPIQTDSTNQALYSNWVAPDPSLQGLYKREHLLYAPKDPGQTTNYKEHTAHRDPWIISCERWFQSGKYIALTLNPESLDFSLPLRVASETTHAAKFVYMWRRRRTNSVTGNFQLNFQLSSGNILPTFDLSTPDKVELAKRYTGAGAGYNPPSASMAGDATKGDAMYQGTSVSGLYDKIVPLGVQNMYALLALANESRIRTTDSGGQTSNRIVMGLSTLIFPRMLIWGWFSPEGITVSMSAENPSEFTVSFTLIVTSTTPKIGYDGYQQLVSSYKSNMYGGGSTLGWMHSKAHLPGPASIDVAGTPPDPPMANPARLSNELEDSIQSVSMNRLV